MVSSIQQIARSHGSRLILHSTEGDVADELGFLADLRQRYVDGLILCSLDFTPAHAEAVANAAVPVTLIGKPTKDAPVDTVRANSRRGAADVVRHLHGAGRRRIALVNGPERTAPGSARRAGYLDGLRACSLERDDSLTETASDFTIDAGREAVERLVARVRPDAIFCANDLLALGALSALRTAGLDVPGDVALVGMDNTNLSEVTSPPLTTVELGSAERASIAAELLLARIEHPGRRARIVGVEPRLIVRDSCGATA
jgi:LacI family transcriptional regulator